MRILHQSLICGLSMAIGLALTAGTMATAATTIELATNGGFETGDFTGWEQFPLTGTQAVTTDNPSSGTYSANLNAVAAPGDSLIKMANVGVGQVAPGDSVSISFDYRGTTADGGVIFAEFFSELTGGGVSAAEILSGGPLFPNADPNSWTNFSTTAIAGPDVSGGVTLQLKAGNGGAPTSVANVFFDNVSITIQGVAVPEPASAALLCLGSVGMVVRRRRR